MSDRDDFWDFSALIPPRHGRGRSPFVSSAPTAPVSAEPPCSATDSVPSRDDGQRRLTAVALPETVCEYVPEENPLLLSVRISKRVGGYNFYHRFREDALPLLQRQGTACSFVPYFSYIPQFGQLTREQADFYLYFRDEANEGRYIQTTQSYILLYVYEIINLPDRITPTVGARRLARIWAAYRKAFPQINKYMLQWLMDYCLLHRVACPYADIEGFINEYLSGAALREFYLVADGDLSECRLDAVLALSSEYQYKNGRYTTGEHGALFLKHIPSATKEVLRILLAERKQNAGGEIVTLRFDAFCGALYADQNKYSIEVRYYSVTADDGMRALITAVVKYAENKIRAALSIRSRLSVGEIPPRFLKILDAYFAEYGNRSVESPAARPSYEALYDADSVGISLEDAEKIENISWQNTKMLVPEEEIAEAAELSSCIGALPDMSTKPADPKADTPLSEHDLVALSAALHSERSLSLDEMERINEVFVDHMGDVVFEMNGDRAVLIEDYRTEVQEFLDSCGYHE